MFWRYCWIIILVVGVLGITPSNALPPEAEEFSLYEDPKYPHKVYMHIIDRYPTVEEMETAEAEYRRGLPLLIGELRTTMWGKSERVGQDIPTGLKLLRHAAYVGHHFAIYYLVMALDGHWGVPKNEILATALSNSSITAKRYWEEAKGKHERGKPIPTKLLIRTDPHKAWQRYCEQQEAEKKEREDRRLSATAEACAVAATRVASLGDVFLEEGTATAGEREPLLRARKLHASCSPLVEV